MSKKIVSLILSVLILVCGSPETVFVDSQMFSQDTVCVEDLHFDDYGILQYVKERKIIIPALNQNFIPQGIAFWAAKKWLIISGYFKPVGRGVKAALLTVDAASGEFVGAYTLMDEFGKIIDGHFSGVAVTDRDLYLSHGASLLQVPLSSMDSAGSSGVLCVAKKHQTHIEVGSCNYSDGILWVCEHYRNMEIFPRNNTYMNGRMFGYRVDPSGAMNLYCVVLVPEKVQGVTVTENGQFVFSISYGRTNPSQILVYSDPRENTPDAYVAADDTEVPLWDLGTETAALTLSAPPMSEGCCAVEKDVYLIFESAAYYYRAFHPYHRAVDPTDRIWKIKLSNAK